MKFKDFMFWLPLIIIWVGLFIYTIYDEGLYTLNLYLIFSIVVILAFFLGRYWLK